MTRGRKGEGVGSWKEFSCLYSCVPPTTRDDVVEAFIYKWSGNPFRRDETSSANGVDTTTSESGLRGIAIAAAQAKARFMASWVRQHKPEHFALHRDHDSTGQSMMRVITIKTALEYVPYSQSHDTVVAARSYGYVDHGRL
jgi:hypothetical protein